MNSCAFRQEHDLLGVLDVPADAYYGVHTVRAVNNFSITGTAISIYPDLINALATIKQAAALANAELGLFSYKECSAIVAACEEIRAGKLHDQFVVDVIQGGAGTSTNMNANTDNPDVGFLATLQAELFSSIAQLVHDFLNGRHEQLTGSPSRR